jgi:hypothetical protein
MTASPFARYQVWHADPPNFLGNVAVARQWPTGYRLVATVDARHRDEVFGLTQNVESSWTKHPQVVAQVGSARSTSVGDILVNLSKAGDRAMVASFGFVELGEGA